MSIKKCEAWTKYTIVPAVAISTVTLPLMAAIEKLAGFTTEASINARKVAFFLGLGGYYSLLAKGRDYSQKKFKPTNIKLHDRLYFGMCGLLSLPAIYLPAKYISQQMGITPPDFWSHTTTTAFSAGVGIFAGNMIGYSIDIFRDLTGIKKSERKLPPPYIKNAKQPIKHMIAASLFSSSIILMAGIYSFSDKIRDYMKEINSRTYNEKNSLEERINNPQSELENILKK
ncbi:MAG: hypothetical protein Q7S27_02565 [Nanoarchaeota archaeon]|nr:hypothetical protein [Nanoarchaeota archaeon]